MKIINCIVCDDIRHEVGNKVTLVGLYDDKIKIQTPEPLKLKWPLHMRLSLFARLKFEKNETFPSRFEYQILNNDQKILSVPGDIKIADAENPIALSFVSNVAIQTPGKLIFRVEFTKDQKNILEKLETNIDVIVEKIG